MLINGKTPDEFQEKAIKTPGSILLIAAAGSGKTFTILGKLYYLINELSIKPEEILLISFTNKSVDDLKKKIKNNVDIYTFHKLALDILKYNNIEFHIANDQTLQYITDEYFYSIDSIRKKQLLKYYDYYNYNNFLNSNILKELKKIIIDFIHIFKTNNSNLNKLKEIYPTNNLFILIITEIYYLYIEELRSINQLDFDDLITEATKYTSNYKKYKYIIIDEFQDTSLIRWNLVNSIREVNNASIFAVGDDYQSIFKFSGCDINIFLDFLKLVPNSQILKLKYTYRNSQELINYCSKFISKNKNQISKELVSPINLKDPLKIIYYFNEIKAFKKILDHLITKYNDILVLGRNNFDIKKYVDDSFIINDEYLIYKNKQIKYLTIHSSKGLEADVVILINLTNSLYGIPNKIKNNKIMKQLLPEDKSILYAEERRLFYVALTRTKNEVYLLAPFIKRSCFVKEIEKILEEKN